MKYCTKCGNNLMDGSKFCNACGTAVEDTTAPQTPKTDEELRAEEQALLDKFSLGLKHERLAWKISGVVWTVISVFFLVFGLLFGTLMTVASISEGGEFVVFIPMAITYFIMGILYLPIAIINLSMKNKLENYRAKLYTDCKDGINHFRVGSIVFSALFNNVAMVFTIVYFIQAKNNATVIERIKARQDSYNSQQ